MGTITEFSTTSNRTLHLGNCASSCSSPASHLRHVRILAPVAAHRASMRAA
jgi:hypothetical protein